MDEGHIGYLLIEDMDAGEDGTNRTGDRAHMLIWLGTSNSRILESLYF